MNNDMLPVGITANIKLKDIKWNGGDRISREAIKKIIVETLEKWADGYCYIEIPTDDAIKIMKSVIDNAQTVPLPNEQIAWEQGYEAGLVQGKHDRLKGEWIKVKEDLMSIDMSGEIVTRYKCSKCGRGIATLPSKLADYYPFCHCGADMRKGDAE